MSIKKLLIGLGTLTGLIATAYAAPWDIDLVDADYYRGYEWEMGVPSEGSVSQNFYREHNYDEAMMSEAGGDNRIALSLYYGANTDTLVSSVETVTDNVLNAGEVGFRNYCQTCHGVKGTVKTKDEKDWEVSKRWSSPIPALAAIDQQGNLALTGGMKPAGMLYLYIKNGFGRMPAYGHAMTDDEIWQVVHYIESLNGQSF